MKKNILSSIFSVVIALCLVLSPLSIYAQGNAQTFAIAAGENAVYNGNIVTVTLSAKALSNMYAYEAVLKYDSKALEFKGANSKLQDGYSTCQKKDNEICFAYTKVGEQTPGENGDKELCTITFMALNTGDTKINLESITAVDSNEVRSNYTGNEATISVKDRQITPDEKPDEKPTTGDKIETKDDTTTVKTTTTQKDNAATATISANTAKDIMTEIAKTGSNDIVVEPTIKDAVSKVTVEMPNALVKDLGNKSEPTLTVKTPIANITISNNGLKDIATKNTSDMNVSLQKNADGSILAEIRAGGKVLEVVNGNIVLKAASNGGNLIVRIMPDGTQQILPKSILIDGKGCVVLNGSATIKEIKATDKLFTDTQKHWSKAFVDFVSVRELFTGTSANTFGPEVEMTRGMLVTVLHKLENKVKPTNQGAEIFSDVSADKYYADAVAWANANKIVSGTASGKFAPQQNITREQLATIIYNYSKNIGLKLTNTQSVNSFSDSSQISSWAMDSMNYAVSSGLLSGKGNNILDPKGTATRAEVSAVLQKLITNMMK